jgi:hypothetical protein
MKITAWEGIAINSTIWQKPVLAFFSFIVRINLTIRYAYGREI